METADLKPDISSLQPLLTNGVTHSSGGSEDSKQHQQCDIPRVGSIPITPGLSSPGKTCADQDMDVMRNEYLGMKIEPMEFLGLYTFTGPDYSGYTSGGLTDQELLGSFGHPENGKGLQLTENGPLSHGPKTRLSERMLGESDEELQKAPSPEQMEKILPTEEIEKARSTEQIEKSPSSEQVEEALPTEQIEKAMSTDMTEQIVEALSTVQIEKVLSTEHISKALPTEHVEQALSTEQIEKSPSTEQIEKALPTEEVHKAPSFEEIDKTLATEDIERVPSSHSFDDGQTDVDNQANERMIKKSEYLKMSTKRRLHKPNDVSTLKKIKRKNNKQSTRRRLPRAAKVGKVMSYAEASFGDDDYDNDDNDHDDNDNDNDDEHDDDHEDDDDNVSGNMWTEDEDIKPRNKQATLLKNKVRKDETDQGKGKSCLLYDCDTCGAKLEYWLMREHMRNYEEHKSGNHCTICDTIFTGQAPLQRHLEAHGCGKALQCELCVFSSEIISAFRKHMVNHEKNSGEGCPTCGKIFSTKSKLLYHIKMVHGQGTCLCGICGKTLKSKVTLATHIAIHSSEKRLACPKCDSRFQTSGKRRQHYISVHGYRRRQHMTYGCATCGEKFRTRPILKEHMRLYDGHKARNQCALCERLFDGPGILRKHMETHINGNPFRCDQCSYSCETRGKMNEHKAWRHTRIHDAPCPECGKLFMKNNLRRHLKNVHSKVLPSLCTVCGKTFKTELTVKAHMELVHSDDGPHDCAVCGKTFKAKISLVNHAKIHVRRERRHQCEQCGKSFSTDPMLSRHMLCHSEDTPFECKFCGKKFKRPNNLNSHMRTHTGLRIFKCDICGQAFKWNHILRNHIKTHGVHQGE